jgi:hypothetical protein
MLKSLPPCAKHFSSNTDFRLSPWNEDKFANDVSGAAVGPIFNVKMAPTAAPKMSSANLPYTPCKNPKTRNQYFSSKITYVMMLAHELHVHS